MKKFNEIPSAEMNGLYWYLSDEHDNRTPNSVNEPEPVLVFTHESDQVQMIKRFSGGRQSFLNGYLLGPVLPPLIDVNATDISEIPKLANIT